MKESYSTRDLAQSAVIAAAYVALSWFSSIFGLTFGPLQFRLSEALCILPFRYRNAVSGLFIGCLLTNLLSPYGLPDLIVGSLATLVAALWAARCRSMRGAIIPPVLCNGLLVGALLAWEEAGFSAAFPALFVYNALSVAVGEVAVCALLGPMLLRALDKHERG